MRRTLLTLALAVLVPAADLRAAGRRSGRNAWCGTSRYGGRDSVWAHREQRERRGVTSQSGRAASFDVGQIAVLMDEGDLALPRNAMDLQRSALRAERRSNRRGPWSPACRVRRCQPSVTSSAPIASERDKYAPRRQEGRASDIRGMLDSTQQGEG
jgi:hypothetical protein